MRQYLLLILGVSIIFSGNAYAQNLQNVEIVISSSSYNYGEKLDYRIIVSKVTGEDAIIFITDTNGNKSQLLTLPISQKESRVIAPFAFDSVIWSEGTYELELQYSGATSITSFTIVNDGTIGIPYWIKDISKIWVSGQTNDDEFAKCIQFLINENIIFNDNPSQELQIPNWFKITTGWWINNQIPDTIYGNALQFLINDRVIKIPFDQKSFS
ncbi:MAG: hypothetical protein O3C04_01250 [Crenarchaeota archaeon]|nr:hypothetical protein [Thermoproteota archaeon]MDA1124256.1 hypothetical protein [Thermoproteota archaeon]